MSMKKLETFNANTRTILNVSIFHNTKRQITLIASQWHPYIENGTYCIWTFWSLFAYNESTLVPSVYPINVKFTHSHLHINVKIHIESHITTNTHSYFDVHIHTTTYTYCHLAPSIFQQRTKIFEHSSLKQ